MIAIFPEIAVAADKRDFEQLAILIRQYFCGSNAAKPRVDMSALVRRFGIPVNRMRLAEKGMIAVRDERGSIHCSIAIQEDLTDEEESFLLAHLLGHFLLHIQPRIARAEWSASGFREAISPLGRYTHSIEADDPDQSLRAAELEADRFAAALIMPRGMFKRAMEKLETDVQKIANIFGVSRSLIEARRDEFDVVRAVVRSHVPPIEKPGALSKLESPRPSAESRILQKSKIKDDTAHMVREGHHKAAPTPKAVAKMSYESKVSAKTAAGDDAPQVSGKGMERLREIARMLDKTGR
ncbi:MAG: ImmA/IrrE family metallo-endopeptidase [Proteobacteria bacterium]|nr:ImmA/IrrE family metallo-endopeptidase [Pseudomonadota bacterium]